MKLKKAVRSSLSRQVFTQLESFIESGKWEVGAKIPAEPELVEQLEVSRNTIREAVQALIHNGMLEARQGDGTYVIASSLFEAAMTRRLQSSNASESLEVRYCLEREIARLAAARRNADDLEKIRICLEHRNNPALLLPEFVQADMDFHMAVAEATHNSVLIDLYKYMSDHLQMSISMTVDDEEVMAEHVKSHTMLYQSIRDQDVSAAVSAASLIIDTQDKWHLRDKRR